MMTQEIEIEYKNLLTKPEFDRLLTDLPFPREPFTQINYYFETNDFLLKQNGCALRIRSKDDDYVLTLKEPHEQGLLETHDSVTKQEVEQMLQGKAIDKPEVTARLKALGISTNLLEYRGQLTTKRRETDWHNTLIVLDYSTYNGTQDYELELEAPSQQIGQSVFTRLLQHYHITQRDTPNKIKRFFMSQM